MFDVEQYEHHLFDYGQQQHRATKSFRQYRQQVRARGQHWMRTVNDHFPDITILLTFGYRMAQPESGEQRSDAEYALQYKYNILMDTIGGEGYTQIQALGVPIHRETIVASCLAVAERRVRGIENGPQWGLFLDRLQVSISYDSNSTRAEWLGYNADRSGIVNSYHSYHGNHGYRTDNVTYNGVLY